MDLKFELKLKVWITMAELFEFKAIDQLRFSLFSNLCWKSSQLGGRGCNVHLHILYRKGLWDMF